MWKYIEGHLSKKGKKFHLKSLYRNLEVSYEWKHKGHFLACPSTPFKIHAPTKLTTHHYLSEPRESLEYSRLICAQVSFHKLFHGE